MYAVIMAGGKGERFWPASRMATPKQCLKIISDKTMIEETVDRLSPLAPRENVFISTGHHLHGPIREVLPDVRFILEPMAKNTAACIGLSAITIETRDPEGIIFIETADHIYRDTASYLDHIKAAEEVARKDKIGLIGIKPTFPSTGFGYIQQGDLFSDGDVKSYSVKAFKEKPDTETAREFLAGGDYLWNSGMFMFKCGVMLEAMEKHMPDLYRGLREIQKSKFDVQVTKDVFERLESISIDYGIMEKAADTVVVRGEMDWDDVGDWLAMERTISRDADNNSIKGEHLGIDTKNCIIFSDKLVATLGVEDLIIVSTPDAVMVCRKDRAQDVKKIVKELERKYR